MTKLNVTDGGRNGDGATMQRRPRRLGDPSLLIKDLVLWTLVISAGCS